MKYFMAVLAVACVALLFVGPVAVKVGAALLLVALLGLMIAIRASEKARDSILPAGAVTDDSLPKLLERGRSQGFARKDRVCYYSGNLRAERAGEILSFDNSGRARIDLGYGVTVRCKIHLLKRVVPVEVAA